MRLSTNTMTAISPIDGRYQKHTQALTPYFSEFGLLYYRLLVEVRFLQALSEHPDIEEIAPFSDKANEHLEHILNNFDEHEALRVKAIEQQTNHDVKAVEYYLKEEVKKNNALAKASEFIHFACTSEDINNLAYALMISNAQKNIIFPAQQALLKAIKEKASVYAHIAILSHTHGQQASPSTMGKEFANIYIRLKKQCEQLKNITINGKLNGAVGNFNAHMVAYPNVDWLTFSREFVESLGLHFNAYTTQIEPHDFIAELSHSFIRINTILLDFAKDMWSYISLNYFKQKIIEGEVGSSTMPHKINPIDFENAEGNLGLANALFHYFADKLPVSRLQRDLSDSTVLRNLGVAYAHSFIAYHALQKGLAKLAINKKHIATVLNDKWSVLGEAIQTVMRRYGIENPYEQLKTLTRGQVVDKTILHAFIDNLSLPETVKVQLLSLTPENYTGLAGELAELKDD